MRTILLSLFLLATFTASSQIAIGYAEPEVRSMLKTSETYERNVLDDGTVAFTVFNRTAVNYFYRTYYFHKNTKRCYMYVIEPADVAAMNVFADKCNQDYIKVNAREWRTYVGEYTIRITLVYVESMRKNIFYFIPVAE